MAPVHAYEMHAARPAEAQSRAKAVARNRVKSASVISPDAIGNSRWRITPSPLTWPWIGTL